MTEFNPLVSIIIPVYNGSNYMREAIDSALNQTYKNIEIIVVNDGSNDNGKTDSIAKSYGNKIRYIKKENGGVSTALNCGIMNMKGDYFSWLSHDDVYTATKVENSIVALSKLDNKETLVCCQSMHIDKYSNVISKPKLINNPYLLDWKEALRLTLRKGTLNGCSLMIPRKVFDECGYFDESLRFNQDGFMWLKIFLNKYSVYMIPSIEVMNRIHSNQVTQKRQDLFHRDCEKMSEYLISKLIELSSKDYNFIYEYIIYNAKYSNHIVVKKAYLFAKQNKLISMYKEISIVCFYLYGFIRPVIRKIYYVVVRRIKTTR